MHLPRSRALRLLGGAAALPALAPALVRAQATVLRVGVIPVDVCGNVFYAQDLGLYGKAGLDVQTTPMASGPVLAQAVAAGAIDIGISNIATLAAARLRGLNFRVVTPAAIVTPGPKPTDVIMVLKDSPIAKGVDFNGKKIAVNGLRDLQEIEARGWVDKNGGDSKTVQFVEIPFPAMGGALEQKRVDIIFPTEPFSTANEAIAKVIANAFDGVGPRFLLLGWFAAESWLASHADVATKFVAATREASTWANGHRAETATMLANHSRVSADVAAKMARATYGTTVEPAMIAPVIDLAVRYGLLEKPVPPTDLIWRG
jgi:NitT/TauT family transport system substrate-binding protein